ncbi:hypothetical protein Syun_004561 [Stephania yunnanensis]|uniref:NADP-dependent oxidoreductase domain-containing protein n=1 Tax=Stephania yunnanensis TaxID=152371 RepID=A0AAP0Q2N3_9MAGN
MATLLNKGCTASQLALAWVHHQGSDVCPIPGTTKIDNLEQNIGALSVKLTHEEMSEFESLASEDNVKGDRYGTNHLSITWKDLHQFPAITNGQMVQVWSCSFLNYPLFQVWQKREL